MTEAKVSHERKRSDKCGMLTWRMRSMSSPRFALRMRCASSIVMRCSRVSLSVNEPDVAFLTPATSEPTAPCGVCFASSHRRTVVITVRQRRVKRVTWLEKCGQQNKDPTRTFGNLLPGLIQCYPDICVPVMRIWMRALGAD